MPWCGMQKHDKSALITGITGQDGAYLAKLLLQKGYAVHGLVRWDVSDGTENLRALGLGGALEDARIQLHHGDLLDAHNLSHIINKTQPDEIYNLAALSHVQVSFETPASALSINALGSLNVFEAVRVAGLAGRTRIYQASSSEMFGAAPPPQNENTPMHPQSPYGAAKLAAYWLARTYRESYGMFISNGILFNHESPLRGHAFVTQKIIRAAVALAAGLRQEPLMLGNLDAVRDWGHAADYVAGMHLMLQHERPDDFVLATGVMASVREFATLALQKCGFDVIWQGEGLHETAIDQLTGRVLVQVDRALFRPLEVHALQGDAAKAHRILGWQPRYDLPALTEDMLQAERARLGLQAGGTWRKTG
jgi:GDPmannose 4,6-dehydratase